MKDPTDKRVPLLNTYLQRIFALRDNIRYDSSVTRFCTPTSDDLAQPPYSPSQARINGIPSLSATTNRPVTPTSHRATHRPPMRPQAPPTQLYVDCVLCGSTVSSPVTIATLAEVL